MRYAYAQYYNVVYITTVEADCNGFKSLEQIVSIDIAEMQMNCSGMTL